MHLHKPEILKAAAGWPGEGHPAQRSVMRLVYLHDRGLTLRLIAWVRSHHTLRSKQPDAHVRSTKFCDTLCTLRQVSNSSRDHDSQNNYGQQAEPAKCIGHERSSSTQVLSRVFHDTVSMSRTYGFSGTLAYDLLQVHFHVHDHHCHTHTTSSYRILQYCII